MRITGGRYVRRLIACPPGEIRPAMDRMRESVFAVLGNLDGLSFLDLFSGSGVIGIEAASRGAAPVTLVERDPKKRRTMLANIAMVETSITVMTMSAERFIDIARRAFDVIFLDPPFPYPSRRELITRIGARNLLAGGGRLLIHHPREDALPESVGPFVRSDLRVYGRSIVSIYGHTGK